MRILYLYDDSNVAFNFASIFNKHGHTVKLIQIEFHITHHALWELVDTDLSEISKGDNYDYYPKEWIRKNRSRLPDWIETIPTTKEAGIQELDDIGFHMGILNKIRTFNPDIIHSIGMWGTIWAYLSRIPNIYTVPGRYERNKHQNIDNPIKQTLFNGLRNRAIKKTNQVLAGPEVVNEFSEYFGIEPISILPLIDLDRYKKYYNTVDIDIEIPSSGFLFFAGARHDWNQKRNDIIFKGLKYSNFDDYHLFTTDWGNDISRSKNLVSELGLKNKVTFLPVLSIERLRKVITSCDAVFDSFKHGSIGSLGRQTLACGTPLITKYNRDKYLSYYSFEHPVLHASNKKDIGSQLEFIKKEENKEKIKSESKKFMETNYGWASLGKRYEELYRNIMSNST
jgi:glycosyltransferase involved in cell wall biosynthesis